MLLGASWKPAGFCLGDRAFAALKLPSFSNGTSGFHYPAALGIVLLLVGVGLFSSTVSREKRPRLWIIATLVIAAAAALCNNLLCIMN